MKKIISVVLTAVIALSFGISSFAASSTFVESIKSKDAPEVVVATLVDKNGNKKGDVPADELIITPYRPNELDGEDAAIQQELHTAYDEIDQNGVEAIFSDEDAASVKAEKLKLDKFVVSDLFDVYYSKASTLSADNKLNVTFQTKLNLKNKSVVVMVKTDGAWDRVPASDVKILGNGKINVSFTKTCPVAFLIEDTPSNTSETISLVFWIVLAAASLAAMVFIAVAKNKGRSSQR